MAVGVPGACPLHLFNGLPYGGVGPSKGILLGISMNSTSGKILASVALVGTAAAVAGMGTFGQFSGSTDASQDVTAARVELNLASGTSSLVNPVAGLLPGASAERLITLENTGDVRLPAITLATDSTLDTLLTTRRTDGLQLKVESCTVPWTVVNNGVDTCGEGQAVLLGEPATPVIVAGSALGTLAMEPATSAYLKITTSLPTAAGDEFQGLTDSITFTFKGTQPTGTVS